MNNEEEKTETSDKVALAEKQDQLFWNNKYIDNATGWDLGQVSAVLQEYIDQLTDKNLRILIPGCGNAYEAEYLLQQGFANITVIDIAPVLVNQLSKKMAGAANLKIVLGDFFAHTGEYDLILEQTFFCAINRSLRKAYVAKMKELLSNKGKIVGVLFNKEFEQSHPPFGGNIDEYISLFQNDFYFKEIGLCKNSFFKRQGTELFINFVKKNEVL